MGEGIIKVSKEAVTASQGDIRLCANSFEVKDIDFNVQSNITAVQTARSVYSGVCSAITKTRRILQADAEHIKQMGEEFAFVDEKLSRLLAN